MILPTAGTPVPVVAASRRPRNMAQPQFYTQQLQQQQMPVQQQQLQQQPILEQQNQPQFEQQPVTGDYLQQQLGKYAQRQAPPMLEPGARIKSPNMELVQPSNFQQYYEQLNSIDQFGQNMLQTAQAKSGYKRLQDLNAIKNQPVQSFNGAGLTLQQPTGGGGNATGNKVPSNPKANFSFAQQVAPNYGWGADEMGAWYTLGMKESGWNNNAQNKTSTAYGIGQFLDSTWKGVGASKTSDPKAQVQAMAQYIKNRYGSPSKALAFHISHNWY